MEWRRDSSDSSTSSSSAGHEQTGVRYHSIALTVEGSYRKLAWSKRSMIDQPYKASNACSWFVPARMCGVMVATLPRPIIPNQDLNAIIAGLNPIQMVCIPFTLPLAVCLVMAVLSRKSLSDDCLPFLSDPLHSLSCLSRGGMSRVSAGQRALFSLLGI